MKIKRATQEKSLEENEGSLLLGTKRRRLSLLAAASGLANLANLNRAKEETGHAYIQPDACLGNASQDKTPTPSMGGHKKKGNSSGAKARKLFPRVLMVALTSDQADDKIRWLNNGAAFAITKPHEFTTEVLPLFFRQTQFESFTRKLKRWGFKRIQWGPNSGAFQHPLFHRDRPELCVGIKCKINDQKAAVNNTDELEPVVEDRAKVNTVINITEVEGSSAMSDCEASKPVRPKVEESLQDHTHSKESKKSFKTAFPSLQKENCSEVIKALETATSSRYSVLSQSLQLNHSDLLELISSSHSRPIIPLSFPKDTNLSLDSPSLQKSLELNASLLGGLSAMSFLDGSLGEQHHSTLFSAIQLRHRLLLKQTQLSRSMLQTSGSSASFHSLLEGGVLGKCRAQLKSLQS